MVTELLPNLSPSSSLIWIAPAIVFHILNIFLGAFMAFQKKTPAIIKVHGFLYYGVIISLINFLIINQLHEENTIWDYLVFAYFITLVPFSKRWDVLVHAFISLIGLTLLPVLIILQM
ncbi:MAG: hypothetical protein HOB32_04990 [Nitrospina sp.]|jgi:hypothetical protein|nr:hypothetical protein [Nitrospina sp.]MBT6601004.1 hypothetical protein [Nitrospina sp.]